MNNVTCPVCPRHCQLLEGQLGFCRARIAKGGKVEPISYGKLTSLSLDRIEKKPLARFFPGSLILSAGSFGCNMRCSFCQNHEISQASIAPEEEGQAPVIYQQSTPQELVDKAVFLKAQGNIGIAFTYNEPGVGYEFVRDTSALSKEYGLKNVMVTNGYLSPDIFKELLPLIDAFNIDLKCFTQEGYTRLGGELKVIKQSIRLAVLAAHVELTTLVVPGLSDNEKDMTAQAEWIASLSPEIPLHISRYFPNWKEKEKPTPINTLYRLADIAKQHLQYVYLGNVGY